MDVYRTLFDKVSPRPLARRTHLRNSPTDAHASAGRSSSLQKSEVRQVTASQLGVQQMLSRLRYPLGFASAFRPPSRRALALSWAVYAMPLGYSRRKHYAASLAERQASIIEANRGALPLFLAARQGSCWSTTLAQSSSTPTRPTFAAILNDGGAPEGSRIAVSGTGRPEARHVATACLGRGCAHGCLGARVYPTHAQRRPRARPRTQ